MIYIIFLIFYLSIGFEFSRHLKQSGEFNLGLLILSIILWFPVISILAFCVWRPVSYQIVRLLGWSLDKTSSYKNKSIMIMAPHTSWSDALLGKLILSAYGIPHTILSAEHLFHGVLGIFMKYSMKALPVGVEGKNIIIKVSNYLKTHDTNILLCPEGHLKKVEEWNPGFWIMALRSDVSITITSLDYKNKKAVIHGFINPKEVSRKDMWDILRALYKDSNAKYPEKFSLPKNK